MPQEGEGNRISVNRISEDYLRLARHPAYKESAIVQNAATASRLIVTGSSCLANAMTSGAVTFTQKTKPNPKPIKFSLATQEKVRKLNNLTRGGVSLSAKTIGSIGRYAQGLGEALARRAEQRGGYRGYDEHGNPIPDHTPGILNKTLIAFTTITDGIEQSAKQILDSGSSAASTMVAHRYGPDAGVVAGELAGWAKNVALVYVDASGVSRRAVIKSVAKGMVVGRLPEGNSLVVGDGDGGEIPPELWQPNGKKGWANGDLGSEAGEAPPSYAGGAGGRFGAGGSEKGRYA
jgi:spartin